MSKRVNRANRRIAVRHQPKPSAHVLAVALENGTRRDVGGTLLDVSLVGAQLAVALPLAPGSVVDVGLATDAARRTPLIPAKVVWCGPFGDGGYRIGIQFHRVLSRSLLQNLCADSAGQSP